MFYLMVDMFERVGFLIAMAFVFSRSKWMRSYMSYQGDRRNHWRFLIFFSLYSILGTYSGVTVSQYDYKPAPWIGYVSPTAAIANSRTVGVVIAGLLGGVRSGFIVGAVAGLHRYSLGGFVAVACMIAPMLQGILGGLCRNALKRRFRNMSTVPLAFIVGFVAEMMQMALILALARPWDEAFGLVMMIGIPQTLANSTGVAMFFMVYNTIQLEEDRIGNEHARKALHIADLTMPQWKLGFHEAVRSVTATLHEETRAVGALFYSGGSDQVMEGRKTPYWIDLPLETQGNKTIGHFRLFYERQQDDSPSRRRMLGSLAQLLSQQYASAEGERHAQLLADAEIRSLQAQMSPHFMFNVLNTVKSFIRTRPEDARQLITHLSKWMRSNMNNSSRTLISIRDELDMVKAYLTLTKARLGDQLEFVTDIDERALNRLIPPFTIQPLVENALVHGLKRIERTGVIILRIWQEEEGEQAKVHITVEDNGVGMQQDKLRTQEEHAGLALENIEQRLRYHYGIEQALSIESRQNEGTKISFWVR
ncbi:LytS/YhcK type 5TM receptor domain-containing protein [Paenibacillus sp. NPDC056579]|uniref:LytS/YhcK type 5TM receptor domain-containing protein n=1 Tax=unclassified Paenibacillus TaxID=185978 RepID=UPI001EF8B2A0|nr:LytS/YhcK type 5TM receptor domain-containing protein [Paenibacillus sp. H1-7]ULL14272.1 sensor histidine kinase [Paenibacillus sp. H1-7]